MMTKILAVFHLDDPASLKRFLLLVITALISLSSPTLQKWGIQMPSDGVLEMFVGLVAVFLLQSGIKSAAVSHGEAVAAANAEVTTPEQAKLIIDAAAAKKEATP